MKKLCIKCGNELPEGSAFCPSCGEAVPVEHTKNNFCRKCGTKLSEGTAFCHKCGTPVSGSQDPTVQNNPDNGYMPGSGEGTTNGVSVQQPISSNMQPTYQNVQPNYRNVQMNNPVDYSQNVKNGNVRAAGQVKKTNDKTIIVAIAVIAIIVIVLAVKVISGFIKNNDIDGDFDDLCEMTSLGTQSYVYARMLTEQLLETDLATADPKYVADLLDECEEAWKSTEKVADNMTKMSDKLSSNRKLDSIKGNTASMSAVYFLPEDICFPFGITAYAYEDDFMGSVSETASPSESVLQCSRLAGQYAEDSQAGYNVVSSLRRVYSGRTTSVNAWNGAVASASSSFSVEMFVSGQITSGRYTQLTNGTHSIRTLSNSMKGGTVGINNTNMLVDVGENQSCIVYSSGTGISMNNEEFGGYVREEGSQTISINSNPASSNESTITFHSTSFFSWFVIDRVGGFTITRGNKGDNGAAAPPEVDTVSVDTDGKTPPEIVNTGIDQGFRFPEVPRGSIDDIVPRNEPRRIEQLSNTITGDNNGTPSEPEDTGSNTQGNLTEQEITQLIDDYGAGVGPITVTLIWQTHDDLDLHMDTPDGSHIYFSNKTAQGGTLDVDKNARSNELTDRPIENIYFPDPENGHYRVYIRDYCDRTDNCSTHYQVKVKIGDTVKMFEGDIDGTDTEEFIYEFDYNDHVQGRNDTDPGENFDETLVSRGAHTGKITVSMKWNRYDDVDLHVIAPGDNHIYYSNKTAGGGVLDVDANAGGSQVIDPVENICFDHPANGHYKVYINQYCDRSDDSASYIVRVNVDGEIREFTGTIDTTGTTIDIFEFDYNGAEEVSDDVFNGHRYRYYEGDITWTEARAMCQSLGGHLVTINSPEEQAFIQAKYPGTTGWIGAYGDENGWSWVTGENWSYTNWAPNEPNNTNGDEWFGHIWNGMQWNDAADNDPRNDQRGYYCEFDTLYDTGIGVPSPSENENTTVFNGHTYAYYDTACSWEQANEYCRSMGGHLVTITSAEEQAKVEQIITPGTMQGYWLGSKRTASGGDFAWITGEPFEYTKWHGGQPDYYLGNEDYLMIYRNSNGWNDLDNLSDNITGKCGYICEWDTTSGNLSIPNGNDNPSVISYNGHTYAYYELSYTWDDAEKYCESLGGHLVTITSEEEQAKVEQMITPGTMEGYWLGSKRTSPGGNFAWITGESFEYTKWHGSQPDYYLGNEEYLMIYRSSCGWNDLDELCDNIFGKCGFICEWDSLDPNVMDQLLQNSGAQQGDITISLIWDSYDDLDLHVFTPDGSEIYYSNPKACGGELDVDANANDERKADPVENIYFSDPISGEYWVYVYNYTDRTEGRATNYLVRITVGGESQTFSGTIANEEDTAEILGFRYSS